MCRLAAYLGEPLYLEELIAKPRHSLLRQSLHADLAKVQTHGDGFGIGWYGDRDEPGIYREALPAWNDENLIALAQTLRSRLFFAHVRAATAGASTRANCHPFRHGRHLFMHNGQIGGYAELRRALEARLPDDLYAERRGGTDSELIFLLTIARLRDGLTPDAALLAVIAEITALMHERGIEAPLRCTAVLSDGRTLWALRAASDGRPPTLHLRRCAGGTIVASEPLCDDHHGWQALPPGALVTVDADGCRIDAGCETALAA
ncbi:MAG: class II glutamine amidotransferase [Burkholderiales bacterium]|nr:class II glutamine amidotransferase [Burkholderiales bacterium]